MQGRGPPRRTGQRGRHIVNVGDNRDNLPSGPGHAAPRRGRDRYNGKLFGQIVSVNNGFGFLQPYNEKTQAYYAQRDAPPGLQVGTEVAFLLQTGGKSLSAVDITVVSPEAIVYSSGVRGIIAEAAEGARCPVGHIEVAREKTESTAADPSNGPNASVPFAVYVAEETRRGGYTNPGAKRGLAVGDEVEFTLGTIPGTAYGRATEIKLIQARKERRRNEKIAALVASGAPEEQGVVETIHHTREFGFVKCADRTGQLYFKLSDIISNEPISEGSEIQFFVMEESGGGPKGPQRFRAVHITVLPKGTVKFEAVLREKVVGVVVSDPVFFPKEAPGWIRMMLQSGAEEGEKAALELVELWPRCLPDGMLLRMGDSVQFDVVNYRPEKLIFARSVTLLSFRRLGRETGTVVKLQRRNGDVGSSGQFGFLKPDNRDHDVFFRINDVVGPKGDMLPEGEVSVGLRLSFDVIAEDGARAGASGSGGRTRAIRACVLPFSGQSLLLSEGSKSAADAKPAAEDKPTSTPAKKDEQSDADKCVLKTDVLGVILRFPKKDQAGVIRVLSDISQLADVDFTDVLHKETIDALAEFVALDEWKEVSMEHVRPGVRKILHTLIEQKFEGIAHETVPNPGENTTGSSHENTKTVKLWKLKPEQYEAWEAERVKKEKSELTNRLFKIMTSSGSAALVAPTELRNGLLPSGDEAKETARPYYAAFTSADILPTKWSVDKDSTVVFNLCLDPSRNRLRAAGVAITDEPVDGADTSLINHASGKWVVGRVESVKHMKGGYIRCFPTDEKLRWEVASVLAVDSDTERTKKPPKFNVSNLWNNVASLLVPDTLVAFQIRAKGGVRSAVGLHAVPAKQQEATASAADAEAENKNNTALKEMEGVAKPLPDTAYANVLKKTETLYGEVVGVVVENKSVCLVDVSACPLLTEKYHDINDPAFAQWLLKRLSTLEASRTGVNAESWARVDSKADGAADSAPASGGESPAVANVSVSQTVDETGSEDGDKTLGRNGPACTINYLPRLHNFPIPFYVESKLTSTGGHYGVGELVVCSVVANWALQRPPLHAIILRKYDRSAEMSGPSAEISKLSLFNNIFAVGTQLDAVVAPGAVTEPQNVRRCGTVRKILTANTLFSSGKRGRQRSIADSSSSTVELWAEIVCDLGAPVAVAAGDVQEKDSSPTTAVFLYDMRGLPKPIPPENLTEKEEKEMCNPVSTKLAATKQALASLSPGDLVDFIPVVTAHSSGTEADVASMKKGLCGMAVAVNVVRLSIVDKSKKLVAGKPSSVAVINPLVTKPRSVFNAALKDNQSKSGFKGISMAEGPPNDSAVGFTPGWRAQPDVSGLPWAHLLAHLPPPLPAAASTADAN